MGDDVAGSGRRGTGPRSRRSLTRPQVSANPNEDTNPNGLQEDLIREFHEAGIYTYAEGLGIIHNGTIASPSRLNTTENDIDMVKGGEHLSTTSNGMVGGHSGNLGNLPGQSVSVDSGSNCSPSRGSDVAMATPGPSNALVRQRHLDVQGEDFESPDTVGTRKKKRGPRAIGGEKGGRGLRQFSMKVCEKVESKGRTTYNEVADELVAEFANPNSALVSPDQQQYDEKNIRRRVYDALNVLMAMDIISKDKKEIQWKGLPSTSPNDLEQLKADRLDVRSRIDKKMAYLQELEEQIIGLQNLVQRNEHLHVSGNTSSGEMYLPFILVQTRPHATVEVEISEDMQLVHFDFNSTPFEVHDDAYVLKAMGFSQKPSNDGVDFVSHDGYPNVTAFGENTLPICNTNRQSLPSHSLRAAGGSYSMSCSGGKNCTSPPVPGILKARVKHEP
ncbi:transcription factor-like protein DPB isoform X1 [Cryptomeria japonica]|uniref:transcription factor-like protein DPB isoform X1 n=1 Tax=Cryptomeria japonica TaxID=3369 RepID=UPI0025AB6DEB|nr:transcription factor-like protein DPB isoform X1 [Cryptomeria japonica]